MKFSVASAVLATLFVCSASALVDERINNSTAARPGQFPYLASVTGRISGRRCGGTIMNIRYVLTSVTCVSGWDNYPQNVILIVGAHNAQGDGIQLPVGSHTNHRVGLSLIRTRNEIVFSARVQPIPLGQRFVGNGQKAVVSGFAAVSTILAGSNTWFLLAINFRLFLCCSFRIAASALRKCNNYKQHRLPATSPNTVSSQWGNPLHTLRKRKSCVQRSCSESFGD